MRNSYEQIVKIHKIIIGHQDLPQFLLQDRHWYFILCVCSIILPNLVCYYVKLSILFNAIVCSIM